MRKFTLEIVVGLAGLVLLTLPDSGRAQGISSSELERALLPGASVPYYGAPFSHVYGYGTGGVFYPGYNSSRLAYLEYLDRLDRQEKFGHRWPSSRCGSDFQVERIERDYWTNSSGRFGSGWSFFGR